MTARRVDERPHFLASLRRAGIQAHSSQSAAIIATVRILASAEILPGPFDYEVLIPPVQRAWVRRVASHNLWLYYRVRGDVVHLLIVTRDPPVPVD